MIDRGLLVKAIEEGLPPECRLTPDLSHPCSLGIIVCGCRTACADRPEVRHMAPSWITVAGETIDRESVPEESMAQIIAELIQDSVCACPDSFKSGGAPPKETSEGFNPGGPFMSEKKAE